MHDYRKAMKRWRSLLRLLQRFLGEGGQQLRIEARDSARELAGARDAQAALDALADIAKHQDTLSERTVASMRARLEDVRAHAEGTTLTQAMRARLVIALDNAGDRVSAWQLDTITFDQLAGELAKTYRRLRSDAPDEDWATVPPDELHELRRRVVQHRYQMELVEPLWPKFGKVWTAEAQRLRDRLGANQDLSMLQRFTEPHGPLAPWRSRLMPLILQRQAAHAKASERIARRLLADKPRAFRDRLETLWKSSQR